MTVTIEEAFNDVHKATLTIAKRSYDASQINNDWPASLKLIAVDAALGEVPSWPAAVRGAFLTVHIEACCEHDNGVMCGTSNVLIENSKVWYCVTAERIRKLGVD